jgi:hypothetical protein
MTDLGGHVTFFSGIIPERWFIKKTLDYFDIIAEIEG